MATSSTLRRAPWVAAARGLLATCGARPDAGLLATSNHLLRHPTASSLRFSSLAGPQPSAAASDAQLLRIINFEISYAQQDCKNRNWSKELGEDFPFKIQDKEGTNRITLTRSDPKEQVEVEVFLPSPVDEAVQNDEQDDQSGDGKHRNHTGNGVPNQYCIPLMVRIRRGFPSCLEISCSCYPNEFVIESLSFGTNDELGEPSCLEAKLSNLPGELQKALYSYLSSKGVSTDMTDFLHAYMINKECNEYLSWLRKLKGLIKS